MIQKLRRLVGLESYEETLRNFDFLLKEEETLKSEVDLMAQEYLSSSKGLKDYLGEVKDEEVKTLIKSQVDGLTGRYLIFLGEKGKRLKKLESEKQSIFKKYPDLEKSLQNLKKLDFIDSTLNSYHSKSLTLEECDMIIKSVTKEKVKYSDNIVFNEKGEVLIVQRGPLDTNGPNLWVLPGGHVGMNELHEVAAKRELREETGYEVKDCYLVGTFDDEKCHIEYFSSMIDTSNQSPILDANETRYSQFVPVKDLYKYPTMYNIWDNVYEILGIKKEVITIKKAIQEGLVDSETIIKSTDKEIDEKVGEKDKKKKKFDKVMHEWKSGKLHSGGDGSVVTDRKQAIAIALSESGQSEKSMKDELHGGKADKKSLDDIAKHHGMKVEDLESEYNKGLKVESEHTDDKQKAGEIAKDHLFEKPDYYTKLEKVEKSNETEFEKSKQLGHLVPKKVEVKDKTGKIHYAIRWVNPQTGESEKYSEGKKRSVEGGTFEDRVATIVGSEMPKSDKVRNLIDCGIYDTNLLTLLTGEPTPQYFLKQSDINIKELPDQSSTIKTEIKKEQADNDTPAERENNTLLREIPIDELWDNYERNLKRVIQGRHKFTIAYGTGGVGKTFVFRQLAKKFELREYDDEIQPNKDQYDYVVVSGKITPSQVYAEMYRHRDKLIVFDDCDSFLAMDEVQGFLKAGLDTGESSKISNKSSKKIYQIEGDPESGVIPNTFSFKGRVIAITNLVSKQIDQAVKSRAMCVNLTMTVDETIQKLDSIKNKIEILTADKSSVIEVSQESRDYAFEVIKEYKDKLGGDINTRTYSNAVLIANDGFEDGFEKDKVRREIISYFDSVTGSFDQQIRKVKGK